MHFKNQPISQNIDRKELILVHDSLTIEHRELILTYMYTFIGNNQEQNVKLTLQVKASVIV